MSKLRGQELTDAMNRLHREYSAAILAATVLPVPEYGAACRAARATLAEAVKNLGRKPQLGLGL